MNELTIEETIEEMILVLVKKLTKEEFASLFYLVDGDPLAGPFWEALADKTEEFFPEEFGGDDVLRELKQK